MYSRVCLGSPIQASDVNYRSVGDLNERVVRIAHRLPRDIDAIVGVPRSGMLAATLLALHLNLPLTDVDGLIAGRPVVGGRRRPASRNLARPGRALVVDDSLNTGGQLSAIKARLAAAHLSIEVLFAAIFVRPGSEDCVDYWGELLELPRVFEWNLMHHNLLIGACVDIDGVLCHDPTEAENDDGPRYMEFLIKAKPLVIPSVPIGWLVTSRLERFRGPTEQWLTDNGVSYRELIMLDMPSAESRRRAGTHGQFKADVYSATGADLFIESDVVQALQIHDLTGKPVFCMDSRTMLPAQERPTPGNPASGIRRRPDLASGVVDGAVDPSLNWASQLHRALTEMLDVIPAGSRVLLLDESQWGLTHVLASRRIVPFTERNGCYAGPPADDHAALDEFRRIRDSIDFVVIGWPATWWLSYYRQFATHLASECTAVLETPRLQILAVQPTGKQHDVPPSDGGAA